MLIDSHCHLDFPNLYKNLDEVISRSDINDVKYLLTISTTLESFEKIISITEKYKNIFGTFGIHPHETEKYNKVNCNFILNIKKKYKKIIGIGETGLDYFYNHSDKESQKKSFIEHIKAAQLLKVPVIVHTRNAEIDTLDILKNEMKNNTLKVLIHCFTGSKNFAKNLLDIGCYISISGIVTFKNSIDLANTVAFIPIDRLLVETDSPYLAPDPYRGKSNEPSYLIHTVEKISKIKKIIKEEVAKSTTENFKKLFNFKINEK